MTDTRQNVVSHINKYLTPYGFLYFLFCSHYHSEGEGEQLLLSTILGHLDDRHLQESESSVFLFLDI
jgi:hypothetical protein